MPRRRASALAVVLALVAAGCGATKTVTVTRVSTVQAPPPGVPPAVALTYSKLRIAAESGDYERLRPLIPAKGFAFSYGTTAGGPIAHWRSIERTSSDEPIAILASILRLPYTLDHGLYVWPFAYDKRKADLTEHERELLGPELLRRYVGDDYYGWRAGIKPDGTWLFFISGD